MTNIPLKALADSIFMGVNASRLPKSLDGVKKVSIIHIKDVVDNVIADVSQLETMELPTSSLSSRQRLLPTDILLSARGTLMKCAVIPPTHFQTVASANFIVIRLGKEAELRPELLWVFLRQPSTQAYLLSKVTGTAQPALNIRAIEELTVPIPPSKIQSDLVRLTLIADKQYRYAIEGAKLRQDEAMDIVASHMDPHNA